MMWYCFIFLSTLGTLSATDSPPLLVYEPPPDNVGDLNVVTLNSTHHATAPPILIPGTLLLRDSIVFTFRTCSSGTLVRQQGLTNAGDPSGDLLIFEVTESGSLRIYWEDHTDGSSTRTTGEVILGDDSLNNNEWYTVSSSFTLGSITVSIEQSSVTHYSTVLSNSTFRAYLWDLDLSGANIEVGGGFTGCLEGVSSVLFDADGVTAAAGVVWGTCDMPYRIIGCNAIDNPCAQTPYPCQNSGECQYISDGEYTCDCPENYRGDNCEEDLASQGCGSNPCINGASCVERDSTSRRYECLCVTGYRGMNCEIDIDDCLEQPCRHGVCEDLLNQYYCNCTDTGFEGDYCELDIDECIRLSPCENGATCRDTMGSYKCVCTAGYGGEHCQTNINECESNPCVNGGTCSDEANHFTCTCADGWTGTMCETSVDDCATVVCDVEHTVCVDGHLGHTCQCGEGFVETSGLIDVDAVSCVSTDICNPSPCYNGATCESVNEDSYTCACTSGWTGAQCDTNIDDCASNPCQNFVTCNDHLEAFSCTCMVGFTGPVCDININDCIDVICQNSGNCIDLVNDYYCECASGYNGSHCEVLVDECVLNPCSTGSTCITQESGYYCQCGEGFTGPTCRVNIDDCADEPCKNGATCLDNTNDYTCQCTDEWMGINCTQEYDACVLWSCSNGGTCIANNTERLARCECVLGYTGQHCESNINDCIENDCENYQQCMDGLNTYTCECPPGLTGDLCSEEIDECLSSPCIHGNCTDLRAGYTCTCEGEFLNITDDVQDPNAIYWQGYSGANCETPVDMCNYSDPAICQHGGQCHPNVTDFSCYCGHQGGVYYTGQFCELGHEYCHIAKVDNPPPCHNGGTCVSLRDDFICMCVPGYTGRQCTVNIQECSSSPCENDSECLDGVNSYECACLPGYTGIHCESNIDECDSEPCQHQGTCVDGVNSVDSSLPCPTTELSTSNCTDSFSCNCTDTGFEGELCENNIDECQSDPCLHGGNCTDGIKHYTCSCYPGFTGITCETDIAECLSDPCMFGSTCTERSHDTDRYSLSQAEGYDCYCTPGYEGLNCELEIDECISSPCVNGTCLNLVDAFLCECDPGYDGLLCDNEINECDLNEPCENNAQCEDLIADYQCQCPIYNDNVDGFAELLYGGKNCSVELTSCNSHGCQNDALCQPYLVSEADNIQNYHCVCNAGTTGNDCGTLTSASFDALTTNAELSKLSSTLAVPTSDVELLLDFRTTLPDVVIFEGLGSSSGQYFYIALLHGRSIECAYRHVTYTSFSVPTPEASTEQLTDLMLNDGEWHSLRVSLSTQSITLTVVHALCGEECSHTQTLAVFPVHRLVFGGVLDAATPRQPAIAALQYTGCLQDIVINSAVLLPSQSRIVEPADDLSTDGCERVEQCDVVTCSYHGECSDLWVDYQCTCRRPYYSKNCSQGITAATFGHNGQSSSIASFDIPESTQTQIASSFEISMFIRTRKYAGLMFYLGPNESSSATSLITELINGYIRVRIDTNGHEDTVLNAEDIPVNDGLQHFIRVQYTPSGGIVLTVDEQEISQSTDEQPVLSAQVLYLGKFPSTTSTRRRRDTSTESFSGTMQDVRLNGNLLEFFDSPDLPAELSATAAALATSDLVEGEVSDDVCATLQPCQNEAQCQDQFFNDYLCTCTDGYRGRNCSEIDYCYTRPCPLEAECNSLQLGYECVIASTFYGSLSSILQYTYTGSEHTLDRLSLRLRTRRVDAVLFYLTGLESDYILININAAGLLTTTYDWAGIQSESRVMIEEQQYSDASWHNVTVMLPANVHTSSQLSVYVGGVPDGEVVPTEDLLPYKGCMEEVRLGGFVLPLYHDSQLSEENVAVDKFLLSDASAAVTGCNGDPVCDDHACEYGGTCVDIWNAYDCDCVPGYNGTFCEINIDECVGHLCVYGECLDAVNMYTCQCNPGYTDTYCGVETNECESSPCLNNGTCTDMVNRYTCNCTEDYIGNHCEVELKGTCADSPCDNNATCQTWYRTVEGLEEPQETFNCSCLPGYRGLICDEAIDYCEDSPCEYGNCTSIQPLETYNCNCEPGYTDKDCDINIDECLSNPCQNEAQCIDDVNGYTCNCTQGFEGVHCEFDIDECSEDLPPRCHNNGRCLNYDGGFDCNCADTGYIDIYCDEDIDECDLYAPCQHDSSCLNLAGSYNCTCTQGYSGTNCETANCTDIPCENNATCQIASDLRDTGTTWSCDCLQYYEGTFCEVVGPCVSGPCVNEAQCAQQGVEFTCHCTPGWNGTLCADDIDECTLYTPCENGATCNNTDGSYDCVCLSGYEGSNCSINIDECLPRPCHNGGVCQDGINQFHCDCTDTGFRGVTCESNIDECVEQSPCENEARCIDIPGSYTCDCGNDQYIGTLCQFYNRCYNSSTICNGHGNCTYNLTEAVEFNCACEEDWSGPYCTVASPLIRKIESDNTLLLIIGLVIAGAALIVIIAVIAFLIMARSKRATRGTYSPSRQEICGSRMEMGNQLKVPPEERLI